MSDAISDGARLSRSDADDLFLLYRWASESGLHGMPSVAYLESAGWVRVEEHPWYKGSWLMRRA